MALKVMYAGQDVSLLVQEKSIKVEDTLGQGAGVTSGSSGRATSCSFLISEVGPAAGAVGAGSTIPSLYSNLFSANQADTEEPVNLAEWGGIGYKVNFGASGGISRDTTYAWHGASSLKAVCDGSSTFNSLSINIPASKFVPGATYTLSGYFRASTGQTPSLRMFFEGNDLIAGNHSIGSTPTIHPVDSGWTRFSVTATMPNPIVDSYIGMRLDTGGTAQAITFWIDGLQIEQSASANPWIPGGTSTTAKLVRHGEVIIYDSTNTAIFGGRAMVLEDATVMKTNYVKVTCVDYWQYLENIVVNKVYLTQTDIFIINDLLTTYAPWLDTSLLPTTPSLTLGVENFTHFTLRKALQRITDKTGYIIWIDATKHVRYADPTKAPTAPFSVSDEPDFNTSFQCGIDNYQIDDTAAINRVYFYGGKNLSNDLTQDLSVQCNGTNDIFILAYYPHKSSDGLFHLKKNGVDVALGFVGGSTANDTLKKDGGNADALLNIDSHTIQWSTAPTAGTTVQFVFRREVPMTVVLADNNSKNFYGAYLDGVISDSSVFDQSTAIRRCKTLLLEQSFGLETLKMRVWRAGIQAGQIISVNHTVRNIHKSFVVQSVAVVPKGGGGFFEYTLQLGAWNLNLVDLVMQLARNATPDDTSSTESEVVIAIEEVNENVGFHLSFTTQTRTMGLYYPRDTAVGDGHDFYPGLASI